MYLVVFCPSLNYKEAKLYKLGRLICEYLMSLNGQLANRRVELCCFHWLHAFQRFLHEVQTQMWVYKWDLNRLIKRMKGCWNNVIVWTHILMWMFKTLQSHALYSLRTFPTIRIYLKKYSFVVHEISIWSSCKACKIASENLDLT